MTLLRPALFLAAVAFSSAACTPNQQGNVSSDNGLVDGDTVPKAAFDTAFRAACGEGGLSASGTEAFVRQPYLEQSTDHSVQFMWTTLRPDATQVMVTLPDGSSVADVSPVVDEQANGRDYDQYIASVDGLEPDTIYCYQIAGEDGVWLESTGFRTAPGPDSTRPIRILAMGDLGQRTADQFAVLDQIENVEYDLAVITGDIAYNTGTLSDFENNFFDVYAPIMRSVPFFVISGNHDYDSDGGVFREVFSLFDNGMGADNERWYSFDWGPIHITALDTEKINDEQAAWLDADLAAHQDAKWKIVFLHKPPFSSGVHGNDAAVQQLFVPLFEKYGVELVLAGHDHDYERTNPINGITYVVTGSGGRGTRPVGSSSFTAYSESVAHFSHITIDGDQLTLNAIDGTGVDFDAMKIAP